MDKSDVKSIVVEYEDGTIKELDKGVVLTLTPKENDEMTLSMEFLQCSGNDLTNIVYGIINMAVDTGILKD